MRGLRNVNWDESLRVISVVERDNFELKWLAAYLCQMVGKVTAGRPTDVVALAYL
jgi:hypothetical protein